MTEPTLKEIFYTDGSIKWQEWLLNGERHRDDGPAVIIYRQILDEQSYTKSNGSILRQAWWLNGERHRSDGPALIGYRANGSILRQIWYLNDKRHREDGPAEIVYYPAREPNGSGRGSIYGQEWYLNGKELTDKEVKQQKRKIANERKVLLLQSIFSSYNEFEKWLVPEIVNLI